MGESGRGCVEVMSGVCSRAVYASSSMVVVETRIAKGTVVPRHSHESDQVTIVLEGRLVLGVEGRGERTLGPGDYEVIPSRTPHWARALEDSLVLDVNAPLTGDRARLLERLGWHSMEE